MRQIMKGVTLLGALIRVTGVTVAALAMLAAAPQAALARDVVTVGDAGSSAMVGTGPGSQETPAQMPGSGDKPVLSRDGGGVSTRGGTKAATNAKTNKGKTGTGSKSKGKSGTGTGSKSKGKSATGTKSVSKAKTTAGTNHQTGTTTKESAPAAAGQQNNAATTAGTNHNTGTVTNEGANAGAQNNAVAGFQQGPMTAPMSFEQAVAEQQRKAAEAAQAGAQAGAQLGVQTAPMTGAQLGTQTAPQGVLGLQGLPSTSTGAAIPAGTIALLSLGGALYAVRRKIRK